jgi:hypothetical protein
LLFYASITPNNNGYITQFITYKIDTMKYYREIKAALIVAFIILIFLWLSGCDRFMRS